MIDKLLYHFPHEYVFLRFVIVVVAEENEKRPVFLPLVLTFRSIFFFTILSELFVD